MSGTIISADPTDILASVSAMTFDSWKKPDHPLHDLHPEGLKQAKRAITRYRDAPGIFTEEAADQVVKVFRVQAAMMLIRRHGGSRWGEGERLINMLALHPLRVAFVFPAKYVAPYSTMIKDWGVANLERLRRQ